MISRIGSLLFFNGESRIKWLVPARLLKGDLGDIGDPELRGDNGGVFPTATERWVGKSDEPTLRGPAPAFASSRRFETYRKMDDFENVQWASHKHWVDTLERNFSLLHSNVQDLSTRMRVLKRERKTVGNTCNNDLSLSEHQDVLTTIQLWSNSVLD